MIIANSSVSKTQTSKTQTPDPKNSNPLGVSKTQTRKTQIPGCLENSDPKNQDPWVSRKLRPEKRRPPVSWNVSYLAINLLGADIFMSFVIHSTSILRNLYSLFHNLSHKQSLSNSFFPLLFYFCTLRLDIIRILGCYGCEVFSCV